MNDIVEAAILKLKADAVGVMFTGFVTNAQVEPPAMLAGQVWRHACADGFGTFADGHRIETSDIVQINACGDSLWVTTRSGSDYGILSLTPRGWKYFSDLYQAHQRLDIQTPGSPAFHIASPPVGSFGLAKKLAKEPKLVSTTLCKKTRKRELLRPAANAEYMNRMQAFVQATIETFERNGVKTFKHDE